MAQQSNAVKLPGTPVPLPKMVALLGPLTTVLTHSSVPPKINKNTVLDFVFPRTTFCWGFHMCLSSSDQIYLSPPPLPPNTTRSPAQFHVLFS